MADVRRRVTLQRTRLRQRTPKAYADDAEGENWQLYCWPDVENNSLQSIKRELTYVEHTGLSYIYFLHSFVVVVETDFQHKRAWRVDVDVYDDCVSSHVSILYWGAKLHIMYVLYLTYTSTQK